MVPYVDLASATATLHRFRVGLLWTLKKSRRHYVDYGDYVGNVLGNELTNYSLVDATITGRVR